MKLPIDALVPAIVEASGHLVIEAPPGAGKTTRVPPVLLDRERGDILVLEPRRLAARLAARRVASELGERVGETVGYQVRFEDVSGPRTRLRFLTEGVLTRRLLSDPTLAGVSTVILDEFHERHLDTDLALALLRRLPNMRLIVMSATLDAAPVAKYLGGCPVLRSEGKLYDLAIEYTPHSPAPLEEQVAAALERLATRGLTGDVLVFLPGAAEIRRAARAIEPLASRLGLLVMPLHGDLSPAEQDRAVSPADRRKVILSTNVAESSVTIEGVTAVIDSGLARVAADSPWTGLPSVEVRRISQASATQRAGRAGRTAPGRVIRLYSAEDFHRRPAADVPEILRRELSQLVLQLRAMKIAQLDWLDPPPEAALSAANALLDRLGVTPEMAELPLPPRLAKLVLEAKRRGVPEKGCAVAAVLSAGERGKSDLLALAESDWQPQTQRVFDQLRKKIPGRDARNAGDAAILQSVLAAFPDRVARHRRDGELLLSGGGSARFPNCRWEFLVAVDIEERREHGVPLVRLAAPIEPEWLLERATERISLEWNRAAERVEQVTALVYDQLVIEETRAPAAPSEEASACSRRKHSKPASADSRIGKPSSKCARERPSAESRSTSTRCWSRSAREEPASPNSKPPISSLRFAPPISTKRPRSESSFPAVARSRFITNRASRPGSNRDFRTSSGCASRRGSAARPWSCIFSRRIIGRCKSLPTWRDSGSGSIRRSARNCRGGIRSTSGRRSRPRS